MSTELSNISTLVLKTMIKAYSSYFEREMTDAEKIDCKMTNDLMQEELDSRKLVIQKISSRQSILL